MNNTELFQKYCKEGNLYNAKQLLQTDLTIDISANDEYAFGCACANGHLEIANWLLTIKPAINISAKNEMAFRYACYYGYLEVAKWLLRIKPTIDISANNDYAFRGTFLNGRLEVAQWLQSLLPDKYKLVVENNKIINYDVKRILPFNADIKQLKYANKEELVCPICYDEYKQVDVQTNCGHNFCNTCITDYYNKCNGGCKCPYCRQLITSFNKLELINISN
jgi:hypothetical protein